MPRNAAIIPKMKVPISKPFFDDEDLNAIAGPLKSGWVTQGPNVAKFESQFAEFVGSAHAVAVTSGTTALHLAVAGLGFQAGDEVILPAFTWISTANVIEFVGAKPVFCDISLDDYNIDTSLLSDLIRPKTKAVCAVHLFGLSAELDKVTAFTKENDLLLIEDAACGLGTTFQNKHVGSAGEVGCFSFHPRKAITTGEGGMVVTNDSELALKFRSLRNHGATLAVGNSGSSNSFLLPEYNQLGFNYRMTDIQGALGVSQLAKAETVQKARVEAAKRYHEILANHSFLRLPQLFDSRNHAYQSFVTLFAPEEPTLANLSKLNTLRNSLMENLEKVGVSTRQGTHAVTAQNYYINKYKINPEEFPNALIADRLSLALPLYPQITEEEQIYVADKLQEEFEQLR